MPINFGGPGVQPSLGVLTSNTIKLAVRRVLADPVRPLGDQVRPVHHEPSVRSGDRHLADHRRWRHHGDHRGHLLGRRKLSPRQPDRLSGRRGDHQRGDGLHLAPDRYALGGRLDLACDGRWGDLNHDLDRRTAGRTTSIRRSWCSPRRLTGGVQATATCTISGGVINTVTVTDQGAGYNNPPTVQIVNDPREGQNGLGTGFGGAMITSLVGGGTITALLCVDHGLGGQTAVPTFTFSGGGGSGLAATAIMCWSVTGLVVSSTTAGSGYRAPVIISGYDNPPNQTSNVNPTITALLVRERAAQLIAATTGVALTTTGLIVRDGGVYSSAPTLFAYGFMPGAGAVQAVLTAQMGGQTDVSTVFQT